MAEAVSSVLEEAIRLSTYTGQFWKECASIRPRPPGLWKKNRAAIEKFVAIGGGAASPLWTQMLADSTGKNVANSDTVEASALGAAMIAGYGAGWFSSCNEAANTMSGKTSIVEPNPRTRQTWNKLLEIYGRLFKDNEETFNALVNFAVQSAQATD